MEKTAIKHKYYPILDIVRFIAALFIIGLHIFPEGSTEANVGLDNSIPTFIGLSFLYAILRAAVPVFFVISSFLLFKRINDNPEQKWKFIGQFCLRLLFLYIFWYIVSLPITIRDITGFVSQGDTNGLVRYIVITLWKGAPRGFWFLASLAFCVVITAMCCTKRSMIVLTIIAGLMYVYGCFNNAYFGIFRLSDDPVSKALLFVGDYLELSFCHLEALIFVVLGKILSMHETFKIKGNIFYIPLAFILMVAELFITMYVGVFVRPDAFFFLPIFIFFLMNVLLSINVQNDRLNVIARKLKKVGSFSYLFHIQFFYYLHWIFGSTGNNIFLEHFGLLVIPYIVCVLLCFGLQTLFEYLSRYKFLRFLKYSY